jgi:glycosyltransferase involved in cell wall biosynthesis
MARALSRRGEEVHVVSHGQPGVFDGVTYLHINELQMAKAQPWDTVIVSRWPEALMLPWRSSWLVLWIHDMPNGMGILVRTNKVFCNSRYQQLVWGFRDQDSYLTSDGVDTALFKPQPYETRDLNKLLWVSNPDRGLPLAAKIFQDLRKRWPTLEFHVYGRSALYGWGEDVERPFLPREEHMENVFLHEPLPHLQLAQEMATAFALFYPTYWLETGCMSALEAQACGTPVISSPLGALPETVKGGILGNDFLNAISQLRSRNRWEELSDAGYQHAKALDWDVLAGNWISTIQAGLATRQS